MAMPGNDPSTNLALPHLPEEISGLGEIALNLWWTWNPKANNLFRRINPYLWKESGHNPIRMLKSLGDERLAALAKDENFLREYRYVHALF